MTRTDMTAILFRIRNYYSDILVQFFFYLNQTSTHILLHLVHFFFTKFFVCECFPRQPWHKNVEFYCILYSNISAHPRQTFSYISLQDNSPRNFYCMPCNDPYNGNGLVCTAPSYNNPCMVLPAGITLMQEKGS